MPTRLSELLILALLAIVLFGYRKLPAISRSIGRSLRILRAEVTDRRDGTASKADATTERGPLGSPTPDHRDSD